MMKLKITCFIVLFLLVSVNLLNTDNFSVAESLENEETSREVIVPLSSANIPGFQEGSIYTNTTLSSGAQHTCAILDDGSVSCWGKNNDGQLGDGTNNHRNTSTQTSSLGTGRTAVSISSGGSFTCVILDDGSVSCWGYNGNGRLGDGTTVDGNTPTQTSSLGTGRTAVAISAGGGHACALLDNGSVSCWGWNLWGQLGDGTNIDRNTPTQTSSIGTGRTAIAISSGAQHTCALLDNGSVSCWGYGGLGELGSGEGMGDQYMPTLTSNLGANQSAVAISSGGLHTCAILDNGSVSCWGYGLNGRLGNGDTSETNKYIPTLTSSFGTGRSAVALSSGSEHTCAVLDNGSVSCWGSGYSGRLGNGGISDQNTPNQTSSLGTNHTAVAISSGSDHTCALLDNGSVSCWGRGNDGQLGNGWFGLDNLYKETTPILTSSLGAARTVALSERDFDADGILNIFDNTPYLPNTGLNPSTWTLAPNQGPSDGGTELTITGSGFNSLLTEESEGNSSNLTNQTWSNTTIGLDMSVISTTLDENEKAHAAYYDALNENFMYATNKNGTWVSYILHLKSDLSDDVVSSSIAIDSNGTVHFSYATSGGLLFYANFDTSMTTSIYPIDFGTAPMMKFPIVQTDSMNMPHIVYYDEANQELRYVTRLDFATQWTDSLIHETTVNEFQFQLDSVDVPHIVYIWGDMEETRHGKKELGSWTFSNVPGDHSDNLEFEIGPNDDLHVISRRGAGAEQCGVCSDYIYSSDNSTWTSFGLTSEQDDAKYFDIEIDSLNRTHITYDGGDSSSSNAVGNIYQVVDPLNLSSSYSVMENDCRLLELDTNDNVHCFFSNASGWHHSISVNGITNQLNVQVGDYGNVTGIVVSDSILKFTTPVSPGHEEGLEEVVDITVWSKNGTGYVINSAFTYLPSVLDGDADGISDDVDDCPDDAGDSTTDQVGCPDYDGDGYSDSGDLFPSNPWEWYDTDGDGTGDNSDVFPENSNETSDSDGDGVGNNADAFPNDPNESFDSDNDGVGDNADVFPDNSNETADSDNDGLGDNEDEYPFINNFIDSDGDEVPDLFDDFINDPTQWSDYDGDGYGDYSEGNNSDAFINNAAQWSDTDGDGYGDNWGNSTWNTTRLFIWPGQFVTGAELADHCPTEFGNSSADGYFGCLDVDGDGIADIYDDLIQNESQSNETNETTSIDSDADGVDDLYDLCPTTVADGYVDIDGCLFDQDGDGVDDLKDACPDSNPQVSVNVNGCAVESDEEKSFLDSFRSGDQGAVLQTVGIGAVLIALLGFLQTNLVAALLPDSVRWLRVFKGNSKLNKEEVQELEYLKSLVQTYYQDRELLEDELFQLKSELTARYTNSEIKKTTREKINTIVEDLLNMGDSELTKIAHNDSYFGLYGATGVGQRSDVLELDKLMNSSELSEKPDSLNQGEVNPIDGYEYLQYPTESDTWYIRNNNSGEWDEWSE